MKELKEILISDTGALALVAGLLVAIIFLKLKEKSVALFCNNTLIVG